MFFGKRIRSLSYDSSNRIPTTSSMPNAKEKKRPRGCSSSVTDDGSKILEKLSSINIGERIKNGFTKSDKEIEALRDELKTESQVS